jgi:gliding motility-associated-like protein
MKKLLLLFIIQALILFSFSQNTINNLVPNYSFEEYSQCPNTGQGEIYLATPWTAGTGLGLGSSDYINSCSNDQGIQEMLNIQKPRTGFAYAGILLFEPFICVSCREYLEVKLINNLKANQKICCEFFISFPNFGSVASGSIGMYFSQSEVIQVSLGESLPYIPQIKNTKGILKDTINWMKVNGSFVASGGEQYLVIGNFDSSQYVNYIIVGSNTNSRYLIDDVSVCDCDDFKPKLGKDTTLCAGQQLLIKANVPKEADSVIYTWQDGSKDSVFLVTQPGTYWVSAYIEDYKITLTDTITVNYEDCNKPIWIPNSFTPNGDGLNDIFLPVTEAELENYTMLIYNRWGQQIFESHNINKGWDGKYKGKLVELGVYTYRIEATIKATKERKIFNGKVTMVCN